MKGIKAFQSPETYGNAEAQLLGVGVLQTPPHWPPLDPGIPTAPVVQLGDSQGGGATSPPVISQLFALRSPSFLWQTPLSLPPVSPEGCSKLCSFPIPS